MAETDACDSRVYLLPLSAGSLDDLLDKARAYAEWSRRKGESELALADLCYAAGSRQGDEPHRLAITFKSKEELEQRLDAFVRGEARSRAWSGTAELDCARKTAFVYCGQGSQWWAMGRQLLEKEPRFRATIEECDAALEPIAGWSLRRELLASETLSRLAQTEVVQPALVALQIALTRLWAAFGITPAAVIGHSVGEISAAHAAGVLTLGEAMRLAYQRGRIMQRATGKGRMAAVALSPEMAREALQGYEGRVSLAACNSPISTVLAGDAEALDALLAGLEKRGIPSRKLRVDYAFHSHQMEPLLADLEAALGRVAVQPAALPLVSTVTGTRAGRREGDFTASYWCRNVRQPVLFRDALGALIKEGFSTFVEVGPHPVLWVDINHTLEQAGVSGSAVSTLQRDEDDQERMLSSLGRLYKLGFRPDWAAVYPQAKTLELPAVDAVGRIRRNDPLTGWFYEERWQTRPRSAADWMPELDGEAAEGRWLIFADSAGTAAALEKTLATLKQPCVRVLRGSGYAELGEDRFQIDPANSGDFQRLVTAIAGDPRQRCARLVYLWGLDAREPGRAGSTEAAEALLRLVQELVRAGLRDMPSLWIVTRGAQAGAADDSPSAATPAWLWGLARVAMHEHPGLKCSLIDLDPKAGANESRLLCGLIAREEGENQIALRRGGVLIPRLQRSEAWQKEERSPVLNERGSYVVAGGWGALGLRVAHWLSQRGARKVWLLGRGQPFSEGLEAIKLARTAGAEVLTASVDLRDQAAVQSTVAQVEREGGPLLGLIDCAGTFDESALLTLSAGRLREVLEDKALAAWNLHLATRGSSPRFFVLFSSVLSLLGASAQGPLAAADAFLDCLALQRRREGLPAVSVRWAPWAGVGIGGALSARSAQGLPKLEPALALEALERLLRPGAPAVATVMPFNVRQWKQSSPALSGLPLLDGLEVLQGKGGVSAGSTRAKIDGAPVSGRAELLRTFVRQAVSDVIGRPLATITLDSPLDRLGLTSLKAVELRNQLEDGLSLRLPATLAWGGHPTVNHFVAHLAQRLSIPLETNDIPQDEEAILTRLFEALARVPD